MRLVNVTINCIALLITLGSPIFAIGEERAAASPANSPLCHQYSQLLNQRERGTPLPICSTDIYQVLGVSALKWELVDLDQNLELLHNVEWTLRGQIKSTPESEFNKWLIGYRLRSKAGEYPILKQANVKLIDDQPQMLVYSYEPDASCEEKRMAGSGAYILLPIDLRRGIAQDVLRGHAFIYGGVLHVVIPYISNQTHYFAWSASVWSYIKNPAEQSDGGVSQKMICAVDDVIDPY